MKNKPYQLPKVIFTSVLFCSCIAPAFAAECNLEQSNKIKRADLSGLTEISSSQKKSLITRLGIKNKLRSAQEMSWNGDYFMPCQRKRDYEVCMDPDNPSTAKRITATGILTKDNPPVEIPLIGTNQRVVYSCVAFDSQRNQILVLSSKEIAWKVKGTSNRVYTSTNYYKAYELVGTDSFW